MALQGGEPHQFQKFLHHPGPKVEGVEGGGAEGGEGVAVADEGVAAIAEVAAAKP